MNELFSIKSKMDKSEINFIKQRVNEFITTNKERYDLFSTLQDNLNKITKESYQEIIILIEDHKQYFFKDHPTAIFLLRIIIRFSKYNLKQMEQILDIIIHFSADFFKQKVTEFEIITLSENSLNPINYLFNHKIISIESIITKSFSDDNFFIDFLPEIEMYDKEYAVIREKKLLNVINEPCLREIKLFYDLVKLNPSTHILNRSLNYHPSKLHKSIREDDIETFQSILSKNNLSVNHRIEQSVYERSHTPDKEMSLIQIAAIYGSLKVFKFLWMQNEIVFDKNLQRYANFGNNYEIIHLFELKGSYKDIIDDLIAFNRHELFQYFLENFGNENINNENIDESNDVSIDTKIQNEMGKFDDEDEIYKSLNYQNLLCAVSYSNIRIILSCLNKIIVFVKLYNNSDLLQRSEFDFELFEFLLSFASDEYWLYSNMFYYSIKVNAFDAFKYLFEKVKSKINFRHNFIMCLSLNSQISNYILDIHDSKITKYDTIYSVLKRSLTFYELNFAIEYYNEDIVVKMIDLFNLVDSQNYSQFITILTENISSKMILSLFKRIVIILSDETLNDMIDNLYLNNLDDVCDLILEKIKK